MRAPRGVPPVVFSVPPVGLEPTQPGVKARFPSSRELAAWLVRVVLNHLPPSYQLGALTG